MADEKSAAGSKLLLMVLLAMLLAGGAAAGTYFAMKGAGAGSDPVEAGDAKKKAESKLPPLYVKLDPPFVSNFESKGLVRFLQVTVEVMTRDAATADKIKQHDPMIRNDLLMLFGTQQYETIISREGKERLRAEALETVAKIVEQEGGDGTKVEQLYFTSFVMQ